MLQYPLIAFHQKQMQLLFYIFKIITINPINLYHIKLIKVCEHAQYP